MNRLDWEKMKEDIKITDVARVTSSSWFVAQGEYTVNERSRISGTYEDTQAGGENVRNAQVMIVVEPVRNRVPHLNF